MSARSKTRPAPLALARKPMARTARVTLFEREVRVRLSSAAVEILLARAQILSEGKHSQSPTAGAAFFGSTMLTIDLATAREVVREACDPDTAARVAEMMAADPRVQRRVRQIAAQEAERLAGTPLAARAGELRVRAEGTQVFLDVDVEGPPAR